MNAKKRELEVPQVEEPSVSYKVSETKLETEKNPAFDFDDEFKKGYTPEQFKEEMLKRIKAYPWKK